MLLRSQQRGKPSIETIISVENDSVLGDVLRLRFHPYLGCEFGSWWMYQRVPKGQGPSSFADSCSKRLQHRVDFAQASVSPWSNHTRRSTSSQQRRVSLPVHVSSIFHSCRLEHRRDQLRRDVRRFRSFVDGLRVNFNRGCFPFLGRSMRAAGGTFIEKFAFSGLPWVIAS